MSILGKAVTWAVRGKQQSCESCGAAFTCGPMVKGGCWCMQEQVPAEKLEELKGKYDTCLCPACLRKAAAEHAS